MSFAKVNGGVVHFSDDGPRHAPVLVFINALGSDFRIWDEVASILSRQFRLIRYDKRGHGLSEVGPRPLRHGRLRARSLCPARST